MRRRSSLLSFIVVPVALAGAGGCAMILGGEPGILDTAIENDDAGPDSNGGNNLDAPARGDAPPASADGGDAEAGADCSKCKSAVGDPPDLCRADGTCRLCGTALVEGNIKCTSHAGCCGAKKCTTNGSCADDCLQPPGGGIEVLCNSGPSCCVGSECRGTTGNMACKLCVPAGVSCTAGDVCCLDGVCLSDAGNTCSGPRF
jgi:hypothetical protein